MASSRAYYCIADACWKRTRSISGYCPEHKPRARKGSTAKKAARGTWQDSGSIPDESTLVELEDALDKIETLEAQVAMLKIQLATAQSNTYWSKSSLPWSDSAYPGVMTDVISLKDNPINWGPLP
jgi:hypothetical protein